MKIPSDAALRYAESAAERVRERAAPIRRAFIKGSADAPPPLYRIMRRGGAIRLKLFLSLLWIAGGAPYSTGFPARRWATLLDLPNPEGNGSRRIKDGLSQLQALGMVRLERRGGKPMYVYVRDDAGRNKEYGHPASARDSYLKLPHEFWTKGWLAGLSGIAIAILLVLLEWSDGRARDQSVWIAPSEARGKYHFSADSWTRGTNELVDAGLVRRRRIPVEPNNFDWRRVRNTYVVLMDRLRDGPEAETVDADE